MVAHHPPRVEPRAPPRGAAGEVLGAFMRLGLSSFGGPLAHLGYFRREFVVRRAWLSEAAFAELVAMCQLLPGPTSSQVGFLIGLGRAGAAGALAAWAGFTLPSVALLLAFAYEAQALRLAGVSHALQLVAVAIVAQAVLGMARSLCPDTPRALIGLVALALALTLHGAAGQFALLGAGALLGVLLCRGLPSAAGGALAAAVPGPAVAAGALALFALLLLALPLAAHLTAAPALSQAAAFYRSGALVFGGGHVVLPLLRTAFVSSGWVSEPAFLAGYGAAQALPGPLFSFGAYLGAVASPGPGGIAGALIGTVAIFLPGLLLALGVRPFWQALTQRTLTRAALLGVNAAVVGLLAAALYDPVWRGAVHSRTDALLALAGLTLLTLARAPPWSVVVALVTAAALFGL